MAELPFVARAPPFAVGQAELICTFPPKCIVGPPEMRNDGQPRRLFGQLEFQGSRRTMLKSEPAI